MMVISGVVADAVVVDVETITETVMVAIIVMAVEEVLVPVIVVVEKDSILEVEHTYSKFYSKLCSTIVKIDLESQGKKAVPINLKYCAFRKKLLDYCREVYEQIFANTDYEALKKKAEEEGKTYTTDDHRYV